MLPSLYKLTAEYTQLMHKLADSDLDAQTIADTIESTGLMDDISTKGQGYIMVARSFSANIEAIKQEQDRLAKLRKHYESTVERLHSRLLYNMEVTGIERIEGPTMTISIRENPESVSIFDEAKIPAGFMRQPEQPPEVPDKKWISVVLKTGADVPGCKLVRTKKLHIT